MSNIDNILKNNELSSEDLFRELRKVEKEGNIKDAELIKERIISKNEGLMGMYKKKGKYLPDYDEFESELYLALARAINKYNVNRGIKWSTYVCQALKLASWRGSKISYRLNSMLLKNSISFNYIDHDFYDELEKVDERTDFVNIAIKKTLLTKREKRIIKKRFFNKDKETLRAIGNEFGVSREAIRLSEKKALKKIKKTLVGII